MSEMLCDFAPSSYSVEGSCDGHDICNSLACMRSAWGKRRHRQLMQVTM